MTPEEIRALRQAATNVVARQKQLEGEQARLVEELAKLRQSAGQAQLLADQARQQGDETKAAHFAETVDLLNEKADELETEIAVIAADMIEAGSDADEAKSLASDSAIEMGELKTQGERVQAPFAGEQAGAAAQKQAFEQDVQAAAASARLAQMRAEMGIGEEPVPAVDTADPSEDNSTDDLTPQDVPSEPDNQPAASGTASVDPGEGEKDDG